MDRQLACATFATVIPVLLIAGHFTPGTIDMADHQPRFRRQLALNLAGLLVVELLQLYGIVYPEKWIAVVGMFGATGAAVGMFVPVLMRIVLGPDEQEAGPAAEGHAEDDS